MLPRALGATLLTAFLAASLLTYSNFRRLDVVPK